MALLTTIALTLGGALVKHVTAGWVGDGAQSQITQDLLDLVRDQLDSGLASRTEQPQIDQVVAQVMQKLTPFFATEIRTLDKAAQAAVLLAVAYTLTHGKIDAERLIQQRLDPARLVTALAEQTSEQTNGFAPDERVVYQRLLNECCRHLVYIANHFAGYTILVDRDLLQGQAALLGQMARLLEEPDERSRIYEDAYRTQSAKQLNKFEQIGIDYAERAANRQALDMAYVALRLAQGDGTQGDERGMRRLTARHRGEDGEAERGQRSIGSIQEMLTHAPRLVIQGQPGAGKSTLLRWLAVQTANRTLSQEHPPLASWDDCVPFYIQLRTFVGKPLPNPLEWPSLHVRQLALKPSDTWIHKLLDDGRALVLIDGVDETPEAQRFDLLQWLQELINTYPWARYLISSRPAAIKAWPEWIEWSRDAGFLTLALQEMDLEHSFHFIDQWHTALQASMGDPAERAEVQRLAEPLKQLVRQRDALRRLARNPLLCTMICALHRAHPNNLPHNRIKLYQDCVEMLLHRRDTERKVGSLADYPLLSNVHEEVALRDYAHHLMINGESEEDLAEADRYFDELLERINLPGWSGARLRHYFVARTGLLTEPAAGRIAFAHRTFQEFLAAREIVKKNEIHMLLSKARDDQWRETILLTIGMPEISQRQSDRIFNGLLNKADELTTPRYRHELYLLAVACLETAVYLNPAMRRHILSKAASLIPPRNDDAITLLAKGGDPLVELLCLNHQHSFQKMARCVAALIAIGSENALVALAEYAHSPQYEHQSAWALRQAIGRGLFAFDPNYYAQRVLAHVSALDLSGMPMSDAGLVHLQGLTALQSLDLSGSQVSDAGLVYLQGLTALQSLNLANTQVSDAGLVHLQGLTALQSFNLSGTQVSDAGLVHLQGLTTLQSLYLRNTQVSDAGLVHLQGLTALQSLYLRNTQVSDAGLVHLQGLTALQSLNLWNTQVSDAGLVHLQGLTALQSLDLRNTQVSDAGLVHLQGLTALQSLDLSSSQVSDAGLVHLQGLTALQSLDLSGSQVSDAGLVHLQGLTALQSLDLWNTPGSDAGLVHLQGLTALQSLDLSGSQVSDAGLVHLQGLTALQSLDLWNTPGSDAGLVHLQGLTALQSLDLSSSQVSDVGLVHLQGLTALQSLNLWNTQVSDAGLVHLQGLTTLQSLNLSDTQVSDAGLVHLQGLTALQSLNLSSSQVSDAGLVHLQGLTALQSLDLSSSQVSDISVLDHLLGLDIEL